MAGQEVAVGRYYLERNNPLSAINRFKTVIDYHRSTPHYPEALFRSIEGYAMLGINHKVKGYVKVLKKEFPNSEWNSLALNLMKNTVSRLIKIVKITFHNKYVIDRKSGCSFSSGLNVFTGETGAGKSIIFDCIGFVFGNKTRKSFLKEKEKSGQVTVEFEIDDSSDIVNLLLELSIPISETLIIRRVEFDDGRRKSYINDVICTTDLLKKIGEQLIEFVDQKNYSKILKKQNHINLLDNFCINKDKLYQLNKIWSIIKCEEKKLSNLVKEK